MIIVEIMQTYKDKELNRVVKAGEILEVNKKRGKELIKAKVATKVETEEYIEEVKKEEEPIEIIEEEVTETTEEEEKLKEDKNTSKK